MEPNPAVEPWQQEVAQALRACATCAVCIGPSGIGPWQNEEIRTAIDRRFSQGNFRVIPVLLPGGQREERSHLPTFLTSTTWVEFRCKLDEEAALHRLDTENAACRCIFLRLTQPVEGTEDTQRRASPSELAGTPAAEDMLKKLMEARLITVQGASTRTAAANPSSAESFAEVSHEALIQGWSKLREWLDADRDALRIQQRLAQAAREWNSEGRANPEAYVYRGVCLAEAKAWAQTPSIVPSALEQEFMESALPIGTNSSERKKNGAGRKRNTDSENW